MTRNECQFRTRNPIYISSNEPKSTTNGREIQLITHLVVPARYDLTNTTLSRLTIEKIILNTFFESNPTQNILPVWPPVRLATRTPDFRSQICKDHNYNVSDSAFVPERALIEP